MKTLFTIFLLGALSFQTYYSQTYTWISKTNFDTITYPGARVLFLQYCDPTSDSVLANCTADFRRAFINGLGKCRYKMAFRDTIMTKVLIQNKGKGGYDRMLNYFNLLTQNSSNLLESKKSSVRIGMIDKDGIPIYIALITDKRRRNSAITLQPALQ